MLRNRLVWMGGILAVLLAGLAFFWTVDSPEPVVPVSETSDTLRLPILSATAITTLDPIQSVEIAQYDLSNQIFEGLVKVDQEGRLVPGLASRWEASDDHRVWRFHLRDARFADDPVFPEGKGRQITADDVMYSFRRGLSPAQGSKNSFALSRAVLGAAAYSEGKTDQVEGLRSPAPGVVEIVLSRPDVDFPAALTVPSTYVLPREAVERYAAEFGRKPVGSGPYRLVSWEEGRRLVLERNPNFGVGQGVQPPGAKIKTVEFTFFRSEAQMATAFDAGDIDARPLIGADLASVASTPDFAGALQSRHPSAVLTTPGWLMKLHLLAVQIGTQTPLGVDPAVRRALNERMAGKLAETQPYRGLGVAQTSILPERFVPADTPRTNAVSEAATVLERALTGKTVRIAYTSSRVNDAIIRVLEQVLTEAGATPRLFPSTSINAMFGSLATAKPDLTLIYWSPYFPNVSEFITALLGESRPVPNFTGFQSAELDRLAARLRAGESAAAATVAAIKTELDAQMPWIPLYLETPHYLVSKRVRNFAVSPVSVTQLAGIELR